MVIDINNILFQIEFITKQLFNSHLDDDDFDLLNNMSSIDKATFNKLKLDQNILRKEQSSNKSEALNSYSEPVGHSTPPDGDQNVSAMVLRAKQPKKDETKQSKIKINLTKKN